MLETKCLESLVGVTRMAKVGNEQVRRRDGIGWELAIRVDTGT